MEQYGLARKAFSARRIAECLELLRRAERQGYDPDECGACRWDCLMLSGRFEEAWRESEIIEARADSRGNGVHRLWDGLPFTARRVLIRCRHGYGDTIQFLRYARLLRREAASVVVQTVPQLLTLLRGMPFLDRVTTRVSPGGWDQQIEVMELPRAFRTTVETIPGDTPYISVPECYRSPCLTVLGPRTQPRVGLLWQGGDWNPDRNVPLAEFRSVFETPGLEFYSFQRGPGREELAALKVGTRVQDLSGESPEVVHLAADLLEMDLVITVDTMAAHLAGALHKPVWVLLPFEADWRWMLDRCDSPWYRTMRLFRQRVRGDWHWPIQQILAKLNRAFV